MPSSVIDIPRDPMRHERWIEYRYLDRIGPDLDKEHQALLIIGRGFFADLVSVPFRRCRLKHVASRDTAENQVLL